MEDPSTAAANAAANKPSQAEILAGMGVESLPVKAQDPLLAEAEARYVAECEKVRPSVSFVLWCGLVYVRVWLGWWARCGSVVGWVSVD